VEIDIWVIDECIWLGHDKPTYQAYPHFIDKYSERLWLHCKNLEALNRFKGKYNVFYHIDDPFTLTSKNFIWTFPGNELTNQSILVLPEHVKNVSFKYANMPRGICSDYIENVRKSYDKYFNDTIPNFLNNMIK
jgi:hypothetical protein